MSAIFNAYLSARMFQDKDTLSLADRGKSRAFPIIDDIISTTEQEQRESSATPEEIAQFQTILMSDNPMVASNAISFFSNTLSAVTPDILRRIFELGLSGDPELAEDATSLIHEAIETRQVPIDDFLRLNVIDYFVQLITKFPSEQAVIERALKAMNAFAASKPELLLRMTTDDAMRTLYFNTIDTFAQSPPIVAEVLTLWNLWFHSQLSETHASPAFDVECGKRIVAILAADNETLQLLALNSLRYLCEHCAEESLKTLLAGGLLEQINSLIARTPKLMTGCLMAIHAMTGFSDDVAAAFIGLVTNVLATPDAVGRLADRGVIALTAILANFAASSDARLIGLVLSEPSLAFLDSVTGMKAYTLQQQAIKVFCFLAITSPDVFLGLIGAHQSWLTYILDATQTSDDHLALSCIECLVSLCRFAESKGDASFRPFIECLLENECFTDEVNARTASENSTLAAAAEALVDYLNR